ncbi:MAG: hypothetical protein A3D24_01995 [Candidatus Blackburnbacteria bacterium RIFCSPHIGHO2_02_FULL_39_13]|uniref:Glycosyl transferase family 1 domain-containing protein n=1 Tax=Candidatus Blackburnbacteria bacterium RIFCSPLOWO2_01_FULL_40_20 TaxID=1797519 RepID=A0A1G1VEG7_9BACT|nr:MAG: Glycosyl transferase group 1 [Microgenomates group bacterium GW2011_GWA2_39_19]OGY06939.1 MAG: hypothetical protein A2694_04125 [Candidatus Blackburnbacteria bacterium RIFCSPHIGHO2_01_FULL_40_17]OGY09172.1 MAG: hypothetical protein A3D24_01995 [Candidatus Blackburnbacteria bacterium RIFCSPHIGHO2_02_FULL_39_13]OGY13592.1 MAG: hypothetical protein A3A77_04360 [Candidatus Blackburnbacteria bacterium RIFCSPLOWO2_01_FULL_40_20]HBL52245.1 hypothetical protein [Candidatus Blackburnbacteria bac
MIIGIDGNEANIENRVGVNQYAAELLAALERLPESKKHSFIIYLRQSPLPHLPRERDGWNYKVLPARGVWVLSKLLPHLWLTNPKPDVLFTPSHYAPLLLPIPAVVSIMDLGYLETKEQFKKYDYYQLKYWGALSMRFAKKIIAISESTKREVLSYYPWAKGKVEVTYPGYDKSKFHVPNNKSQINSKIQKVKTKYRIHGKYILFLSTLKPSKNIEGLLGAFKVVSKDHDDLQLVISGKKGWLYESIFNKVISLDLQEKVIFTDFVSEEDKVSLIAGCLVIAAPSFTEGFGMHVLEAMGMGIPVVVASAGSLPEVVGSAGIIVDPNDPKSIAEGIEKALEKHDVLSDKVKKQANKFDWEKTANDTLQILEKAV